MTELTEYEKLDIILKYLEEIKGLKTPLDNLTKYLAVFGASMVNFFDLLQYLEKKGLIEIEVKTDKVNFGYWYKIKGEGSIFINAGGFVKSQKEKEELDTLTKQKLILDVTAGENTIKDYPRTRLFAIIGLIIAVILSLLKLLEVFRVL